MHIAGFGVKRISYSSEASPQTDKRVNPSFGRRQREGPEAPPPRPRRWVAQEREIFTTLTVEENLNVAARAGRWDLGSLMFRLRDTDDHRG